MKYLVKSFTVALILFCGSMIPTGYAVVQNQVTTDDHVNYGFTYWEQSDWGKGGTSWDWDGVTSVDMSAWAAFMDWNSAGLLQGRKPFGWAEAPWVFPRVPDIYPVKLSWVGMMYNASGTFEANLGVDLWFEVEYGSDTKIAEIYFWFYMNGIYADDHPVGNRYIEPRTADGNEWIMEGYHHSQMPENELVSYEGIDINYEIEWVKDQDVDETYKYGTWYLIGIDGTLEVEGGFLGGVAYYNLDYLRVWYDALALDISIFFGGGSTDPAPGTYTYGLGEAVTVTAYPDSGQEFGYWLFDGSEKIYGNPVTITMDTDHTLEAHFSNLGPPSPGGCPYVSTWNGTDYALDNNLIPAAEYSNGTDVTDYYKLQQLITPSEGKYSLQIWDLDKHSFLDYAHLVAVDHESDLNIAVSPYGEILTYTNPAPLTSAVTKNGTDVLSMLVQQDDQFYQGYYDDYIELNFAGVDIQNGAKLVVTSDYCPFPPCDVMKCPTHIQVLDSTGDWQTIATIHTRIYWAIDIVDLSDYLPDANGELKVRVSFTGEDKIDYIGLDTTKHGDYELTYANMVKATHTRLGDVKEGLTASDDMRVELLPGEQFTIQFTLPQNAGERRDFVMVLEGHYYTIHT